MDYTKFIKDELSKFRLVLNGCGVVGEEWRKYMAIKIHLLKGQFGFERNLRWYVFWARVQPLVRVRNGKVVWWGKQQGDCLAKVTMDEFGHVAESENSGVSATESVSGLQSAGEVAIYFPSDNPEIFRPSVTCIFQQLPENIKLNGLLFELRLEATEVCKCYDNVLKCHIATLILYYHDYPKSVKAERDRELTTPAKDLEVQKVREARRLNEPAKSNKIVRTSQSSR